MKKKITTAITSILVALALIGTSLVASPAQAKTMGGTSIGVLGGSIYSVQMTYGYANKLITVGVGHWNYEYGDKNVIQSVNSFYIFPKTCVLLYKLNPGATSYTPTGYLANPNTYGYTNINVNAPQYLGKFNRSGRNLLLVKPYVNGSNRCG